MLIAHWRWAEEILAGEKVWEMQSRRANVRERFRQIFSGSGLILAEATLADRFSELSRSEAESSFDKHQILSGEIALLDRYPWVLRVAEPV